MRLFFMATGVPKDGGVREHLFAGSASCGKDAKMENINVIGSTVPAITTETTLGELLAILNLGEKPHETPTPKMLRETAGDPIAVSPDPLGYGDGCIVYSNGYAVYDNGSGRTVVWLPDCKSFTYYFVKPKESEIGIVPEKETLPDGLLESLAWPIAVTLIGDHRVEDNLMNRTGSRTGTKDFDADDNGDKDGDAESAAEKALRNEYFWREGRFGENPEDAYIRKEQVAEMLDAMTEKQREVFVLYYKEGYTQQEIADMLGIERRTVGNRLEGALKKVKKSF